MGADGSNVRPFVTGRPRPQPTWSPDGDQLMIISNRDGEDKPRLFDLLLNDDGTVSTPRLRRTAGLDPHLVAP